MIIGIVGTSGSGKTTAAKYLQKKGFYLVELSSFLIEEARRRKITNINKKSLQDLGNECRKKLGTSVLARWAFEKIKGRKEKNAVISGIRNPKEITYLINKKNFYLLGIDAQEKTRYQRVIELRGKKWMGNFANFLKIERRDSAGGEKGLQAKKCLIKAKKIIINNSSLESFYQQINYFLAEIKKNK